MKYNPDIHHRRSIRLKDYDYSQSGAYFVTVCVQNDEISLGDVINGEMKLNDAGRMVKKYWEKLPDKFPGIETDVYVVMPNHFHGIVIIVGADPRVCPNNKNIPKTGRTHGCAPTKNETGGHAGPPLPKIVQWFKTMTTNEYIGNIKKHNWPFINGKFWQRNYYEHIIRHEDELNRIREYIVNNPLKWYWDRENPASVNYNLEYQKYFMGICRM